MKDAFSTKRHDEKEKVSAAQVSGAVNSDMNAAAMETHMDKFHAAQGHGYAAEQANHLYDTLTGKDATIIGGDNAKNGGDRLVDRVIIQTKYYQTASGSVSAAFDGGRYRYINADGTPMQLEVPSDQYEKAVELMARRIRNGQVPGITDPAEAKALVRRGQFTYQQTVNIVKFGTIESLTFDAAHGAVVSTSAFGISTVLTFAQCLWRGDSVDLAVENALCSGMRIGGVAFANTVITAQLARTALPKLMAAPTDAAIRVLGPKTSASIANALRDGANIYGAAAMSNVSKLLRGNLITSGTMLVLLSARDIGNAFQGRISGQQLFKNIATTAGGIAGGTAGVLVGRFALNLIAPGAGEIAAIAVTLAGGALGGGAGGSAVNAVVGKFVEDDAVAMTGIIKESFCRQAQAYLLTQEEIDILLEDLGLALSGEALLDMFASADHRAYADRLVQEQIERLIRGRARIHLPADREILAGMERLVTDAELGRGIFSPSYTTEVDAVALGRQITGQELSPRAAKKGLYAARQMNLTQRQSEGQLEKMAESEARFHGKLQETYRERTELKRELDALLGGGDK